MASGLRTAGNFSTDIIGYKLSYNNQGEIETLLLLIINQFTEERSNFLKV
jgi:hypothetical protein